MAKDTGTVCRIDGCDRLVSRDGYCRPHHLAHCLKLDPKLAGRDGLPLGRLTEPELKRIASRPHRCAPVALPNLDERPPRPPAPSLTMHQLRELGRHGPHLKRTCRRCDYPEARDGLCRHHWVVINVPYKLRRDIAQKIPVETLTLDKLADIRDLPVSSSWLRIKEIADRPFLPEPLETEQRRHNLRRAYRSATTLTLAAIFGWRTRHIGNQLPPSFAATPRPGASPEERVIMAISPHIAEALHLGRPTRRTESHLSAAVGHSATFWPAHRQDAEAIAVLKETFPDSSPETIISAYRSYESEATNRLLEAAIWRRIRSLAEALVAPA